MSKRDTEDLTDADPEFRRLHEEHRDHEERLQAAGRQTPPLRGRGNRGEAAEEGEAPSEGPHGSHRPSTTGGSHPLRIPIAREGWPFIVPALAAAALAALTGPAAPGGVLSSPRTLFLLQFFRDPERSPEGGRRDDRLPRRRHRPLRRAERPRPRREPRRRHLDLHVGLQLPRQPLSGHGAPDALRLQSPARRWPPSTRRPRPRTSRIASRSSAPRGSRHVQADRGRARAADRLLPARRATRSRAAQRIGLIKFGSRVDLFVPDDVRDPRRARATR